MARPKSVTLGGKPWAIKYPDLNEVGLCGDSDHMRGRIRVCRTLSPWEARDTLLHELMHSVLRSQGRVSGDEVEELYVRALATGLLGVLREHPEIVKYLFTEKLK